MWWRDTHRDLIVKFQLWGCFMIVKIGVWTLLAVAGVVAQTTTGEILGTVVDASGALVAGARVKARNLETNAASEGESGANGTFRFPLLPLGSYEVMVEKAGFARYQQGPIVLRLNQQADLRVTLSLSGTTETVTVNTDAPLINTTNAEVSTHFDSKLSTNRNLLNLAASVPGVAQLSSGNANFGLNGNAGTESGSLAFSANGMRLRSNAFIIDGQDSYYPSTGGLQQPLNNPDIIAEIRIVTNQFLPEYGRAAGSVMSFVTKSGTNDWHGSAFEFHNSNRLNALSNTDKLLLPRPTRALFRVENQFGGTFGGRIIRDRTFFFASLQRWTDRRLGSGTTINGAPTEEGRRALQDLAGSLPTVAALLGNLPAGAANGTSRTVTYNGRTAVVPLGSLTGAAAQKFNDWQYSLRGDHRFNDRHGLMLRYLDDNGTSSGTGQATPVGLTNVQPLVSKSAAVTLSSSLSPTTFNEARISYSRQYNATNAEKPEVAQRIPSIEVADLGLTGFNSGIARTAIGLAANLPSFGTFNNYQIQETVSMLRGNHSMKFGLDFRRQEQFSFFVPNIRGQLEYASLQTLINDQATRAQVQGPLRGGEAMSYFRYYDYFFFLQDEWRVRPNLTLSYGIRYESPGNPIQNLKDINDRVVAANGNDERFRLRPVPARDRNNWAPRFGFNYRFGKASGLLAPLTGDGKLVLRGGYSRTYDIAFNNIALNVSTSFPAVYLYQVPFQGATVPNAFNQIQSFVAGNIPAIANPGLLTRTIVDQGFRAPLADQYSLQIQRELAGGFAFTLGYVGTKGTALFQTIDGNPTVAGSRGAAREDPTAGIIRLRCNCTSSTYHSMQTSLEKRLSRNFSMAAHYTWSSFIDGASEIFNPSVSGEIAFPQNPRDRRSERARATYDRPHRFTTNGVFELPFLRAQKGFAGKVLGGWQINGFLTLQSGAPFGVLNGSDPGGVVLGNLVGTSIRPNLNTALNLSSMQVREIQQAGGAALFRGVTADSPIGNAGRNILRADGINRLDLGLVKNFRVREGHNFQLTANFFSATNTRDWGIPEARITAPAFLNEGAAEVPARRIQLGLRYAF
jgi:hypothetical protein